MTRLKFAELSNSMSGVGLLEIPGASGAAMLAEEGRGLVLKEVANLAQDRLVREKELNNSRAKGREK